MSKKIQDLLIPRYKVVADYPLSSLYMQIGDILTLGRFGYTSPKKIAMAPETVERYPHLFRKLEWFEERDFDLTGLYVRFGELDKVHSCFKLLEKIDKDFWRLQGRLGEHVYPLCFSYPITQQEYENFINKK